MLRPLLAVTAALLAPVAGAQTFERFGVRDGLPSEQVHDVALGPDGMLWVATDDGLARYDGHRFRTWRAVPGEPDGLPSSRVFAVWPTETGVWAGTAGGAAFLDLRTGRATAPAALPTGIATDLVLDPDGTVWVGYANDGLWRYAPASGQARRAVLGRTGGTFGRTIVLAIDGRDVWAEMSGAADGEAGRICRVDPEMATCAVGRSALGWRLLSDAGHAVLVRKDRPDGGWIAWLDGERWRVPDAQALSFSFRSILRLDAERAWIRTESVLAEVGRDGVLRAIPPGPGLRGGLGGYDARALARDRQGNVWVGTEAGLYYSRVPARTFATHTHVEGDPSTISDDRVNGMAQGADGSVWIATNGGLNRLDPDSGTATRYDVDATIEGVSAVRTQAFWQVLALRDGRVLVGAKRAGLSELRAGALRPLPLGGIGTSTGVRGLLEDAEGRVWVSTSSGLWSGRPGAFRREDVPGVRGPANVVFQAADRTLWLGTDEGLFRQRGGGWARVARDALCAPIVWSMAESTADPGGLWAATVGGGVARLDAEAGTVECVTVRDGLPTNSVYGVLSDAKGFVWASTTSGLARIEPRTGQVATFSSADGLAGDAFNLMAQLRLADGRLAFGGPSGLTLVDPLGVAAREPPEAVVTGVERQGRLLPFVPGPTSELRLAHDANGFGVRFAVADFRAPRRTRYRYRLVGLDDDWIRTDGSAPRAAYTDVPPGRYRFEVQGAAADTPFSDVAALEVYVVPALWQRWSVRVAALFLALGGVVVVGTRRRRRAEHRRARAEAEAVEVRRRLAEARERERVRLARDLHDGPVQNLYRVGHDLDQLGDGAGPVRQRVGDIAGELRQMLSELRPTLIDHLGLGAALRVAGRNAESRFPHLTVSVEDRATNGATAEGALALFRIAQEAVQNAGRHAGAAHVQITLSDDERGLSLVVRDNGRGFVLPDRIDLARSEHFGLIGAQERAEAVGGTFSVTSAPGEGTTIRAWVPQEATALPD